jgi:hypothetical protein
MVASLSYSSDELVKKCLEHPHFPDDFGIDTFLTTVALANDFKIQGGILDAKFHESTSKYVEPKRHLLSMFHQVTETLFDLMKYYEKEWKNRTPLPFHEAKRPRKLNRYKGPRPTAVSLDTDLFRNAGQSVIEGNLSLLKKITGDYYPDLLNKMDEGEHLDGDTWAETVVRAAALYKRKKEFRIIEVLGGVWLGRYASFAETTKTMNLNVAELDVHKQMLYFLDKRDLLMDIY